jgi:DHA1 family tetracycline resistance protein-like MFS transporter
MKDKKQAAIGFIFITVLIDVIGLGIVIPVLPRLIEQLTGQGITKAASLGSWLLFAYALMQFLFSPVIGALSDHYGRRPVLLLSLLGLGIDYIFQAMSPTITYLFIGRVIAGISGASFTTASAYIADISTPEKRAQNFGMIGAAFGVGFIIGPSIGGLCSHFGEYLPNNGGFDWRVRLPFVVSAGFSFLNLIYGYFVLPESLLRENRRKVSWRRANPIGSLLHLRKYPVVSGLVVSLVCIYLASHAIQSNWSFYTIYKFAWTPLQVGISLSVVGLVVGLVQGGLIRYTMPKFGEKKSVYYGLALHAIGMAFFAFANQGWMMYVILVPYCLGGICGPALQAIMSGQVPPNEQGELQGASTSLMSVTSFIGPVVMNNLFSFFTGKKAPFIFPGMPFLVGAVLMVVAIFLAVPSLKRYHLSKTAVADG